MELVTTAQVLEAYSRGAIPPEEAIRRLGVTGFGDLMLVMADCEVPLPRGAGEEAETERELREALPILRANLVSGPEAAGK
ncbi:MAG: hypothetical protein F4213_09505 [Boseongicola sp. SB0677_bin_26]|nr:hypothetical protein [Boseongicola sp. SB0665_bin_10]MYG26245.1 hypothetical protein [Boseongicola sp. SB0677_bin_26]